jgi:lysozyme
MQPSAEIKAFIKARETLVLERHWDAIGQVYDIGYGHVLRPHEQHIQTVTPEEADAIFDADCQERAQAMSAWMPDLPQQAYDACFSLAYNIGLDALRNSTLLQYLQAGMLEAACIAFLDWNKAGGKFVQGLLNRRALEMLIFARGEYR